VILKKFPISNTSSKCFQLTCGEIGNYNSSPRNNFKIEKPVEVLSENYIPSRDTVPVIRDFSEINTWRCVVSPQISTVLQVGGKSQDLWMGDLRI
jgi:hypothetical protein